MSRSPNVIEASTGLVAISMPSPLGELRVVASETGLVAVLWPADDPGRVPDVGAATLSSHPLLDRITAQLGEYFDGARMSFDLPLDLRGTPFQVKAWRALATIPYGETVSYAQQADRIGAPTAVRAVGSANGRNPASIVLPCHRVIGSNGSLTGFAGGLDAKRSLLSFERRCANGDPRPMQPLGPAALF